MDSELIYRKEDFDFEVRRRKAKEKALAYFGVFNDANAEEVSAFITYHSMHPIKARRKGLDGLGDLTIEE